MENSKPRDKDDSRSVSEKSSSDQGLTKQASNGSTTSKGGQMHDVTPTGTRSEQSTTTPAMPPPPRPNFKATPTSAQPSDPFLKDLSQERSSIPAEKKRGSGRQRAASSKDQGQEATKPMTRKRSHEEIDRRQAAEETDDDDDDDDDATDEFKEPANAISPFDWVDLRERYHRQVKDCANQERDLYRQFQEICSYFSVWVDSGMQHETERSFKRMRTQVTLVQHNEEQLELKRLHYIKVVEAFKSALQLLTSD